jgi:DNA invertase Pin-like site-specific DNA recombinase
MQNSTKTAAETTGTAAAATKTIGYLRVSTASQELEKNKADILTLANDRDLGKVTFIEEVISGKVSWRNRKLAAVLNELKKGDSIIVSELSRLGRSMLECMELLSIATSREIKIYSVKGNWNLDGTLQSKILAMAFSMASEIERELISSRTVESLRHCKAMGIKLGRPSGAGKSKLDKYRPEIEALLANGSTQRFVANRFDTTPENLNNWLKMNKIDRKQLKAQQPQAL